MSNKERKGGKARVRYDHVLNAMILLGMRCLDCDCDCDCIEHNELQDGAGEYVFKCPSCFNEYVHHMAIWSD